MAHERLAGLLYILIGFMLIICPMFSSTLISISIGFALVCLGMASISVGILISGETNRTYSISSIVIGFISLIFGMLFIFFLNALTFLTSLQFYIVGILLAVYGVVGLIYLEGKYKIYSIVILVLGILNILLATFFASQPVLIAVLIGVALVVEGVFVLVIGSSKSLIEKYE